jgi:hypothetical protein
MAGARRPGVLKALDSSDGVLSRRNVSRAMDGHQPEHAGGVPPRGVRSGDRRAEGD